MLKVLLIVNAVMFAAGAASQAADPALGQSAKDRHAAGNYIASTADPAMSKSATDRHAPGNYAPLK